MRLHTDYTNFVGAKHNNSWSVTSEFFYSLQDCRWGDSSYFFLVDLKISGGSLSPRTGWKWPSFFRTLWGSNHEYFGDISIARSWWSKNVLLCIRILVEFYERTLENLSCCWNWAHLQMPTMSSHMYPPPASDIGDPMEIALFGQVCWTTWLLAQCHEGTFALIVEKNHSNLKDVKAFICPCVLGSKLPLFSYGRDGHQPFSSVLFTHYKDSLLKVGGLPSPMAHVMGHEGPCHEGPLPCWLHCRNIQSFVCGWCVEKIMQKSCILAAWRPGVAPDFWGGTNIHVIMCARV